jgi:CelD/BcsL family acetyltransferase involved in cellulose biosynthesis
MPACSSAGFAGAITVSSTAAAAPAGTRLETISDPDALARLRPEWDELLEQSPADSVFVTWEWLATWWKHLSPGRRLHLIAVRRGAELIAIAPLMVSPPRPNRLVPFRSLAFLGTGSAGSDYLDVIIRRGRQEEALDALAPCLQRTELAIELGQVSRESCMAMGLVGRLARQGWERAEQQTDVCPFIPLAGVSWPAYLAGLTIGHRANFKRRLSNLGKTFDLRFERAETESERRAALSALIDLHHLRWRERGGSTALYTPALLAFHDEWTRLALERGWLRLFVMKLDGRPVAALYGIRYRRAFCFYQTGFDPSFARYGVGQVTVGLSIKSAIDEGVDEYDLLHGAEPYKFDWARQVRELSRIALYPPGVRGALHRRLEELGRTARRTARRLLPQAITDRIAGGKGIAVEPARSA